MAFTVPELYECVLALPATAADTCNSLHQAVWAAVGIGRHQPRDFLYAAATTRNGVAVKVRALHPRAGWHPAVLPGAFHAALALAIESRCAARRSLRSRPVTIDGAQAYLRQHLRESGIAVDGGFRIQCSGPAWFHRRPRWSTFAISFDGHITDRAAAEHLFADGIGRGRAFGYGMLLARPQ